MSTKDVLTMALKSFLFYFWQACLPASWTQLPEMEVLLLYHRCFFFGLPPHVALGTSNQQGSFGTLATGQLIGARIGSNPAIIHGTPPYQAILSHCHPADDQQTDIHHLQPLMLL